MLQARFSKHDQRLYNPNRDVAHNFGFVAMTVAKRLEHASHWPVLERLLKDRGIAHEELGAACEAYCRWVRSATENPKETMDDGLRRCGWYAVPDDAQLAFMSVLGCVVAGVYWAGVREAMIGAPSPCLEYEGLCEAGEHARKLLMMPPWRRRRVYKFTSRFRAAWDAVRGKKG